MCRPMPAAMLPVRWRTSPSIRPTSSSVTNESTNADGAAKRENAEPSSAMPLSQPISACGMRARARKWIAE